ncbi:MAG: DUF4331 family protein [Tepidiformaceae bacterium]
MRLRKLSVVLAASALGGAALGALPAIGADHKDAPLTKAAAQSDINDVYVFKGTSGKPVLVMTVNPLTSPADTSALRLDTNTVYEFKIDLNGDAVADAALKLTASGSGPIQDFTLRQASGAGAVSNDPVGTVLLSNGKTSTGINVTVNTDSAGHKVYVGPRDDPFFFDLGAFNAGLAFTNPGVDTFKGTNITAIVIELPDFPGGSQSFGVWGTTAKQNNVGAWAQLDRMGRPAILTVFIPPTVANMNGDLEDEFNQTHPDRDKALWKATVVETLNNIAAFLNITAKPELADILLPDILTADFAQAIGYLNGRGLADDVIDGSLQVITGIAGLGDGVPANDKAFLAAFPYLAEPHGAAAGATPTTAAPRPPNTGSGADGDSGSDAWRWTLPAGLIAAALLMGAAGYAATRREAGTRA